MTDDTITLTLPADPGVLSLKAHRELKDQRAENQRLREENDRLRGRIRELDQTVTVEKITPHSKGTCHFHLHVQVDEETPVVECVDCGTKLDAWQVLLEFARGERHFRMWEAERKKQHAELTEDVAKLKAEKSRLKTECKRLTVKAGGRVVARNWHEHERVPSYELPDEPKQKR